MLFTKQIKQQVRLKIFIAFFEQSIKLNQINLSMNEMKFHVMLRTKTHRLCTIDRLCNIST